MQNLVETYGYVYGEMASSESDAQGMLDHDVEMYLERLMSDLPGGVEGAAALASLRRVLRTLE